MLSITELKNDEIQWKSIDYQKNIFFTSEFSQYILPVFV